MDILVALFVAVLLAFVPAVFLSWIIYWLDRYEREPKLLLFAAFFWGAVVAIIGAVIGSLIMDAGVSSILNAKHPQQSSDGDAPLLKNEGL